MTFIPGLKGLSVLSNYRRPVLKWVSATEVDIENNTGGADETLVVFDDGDQRTVAEDTSSTHKFRRFNITATAEFTSGTEDSGMRSGESEANNTWYALYAVKSLIDSTKFVIVGTTVLPLQANFATLNSNFNTSGWIYIGLIRNGNSDNITGDILEFVMSGNRSQFVGSSALSSTHEAMPGVLLANGTGTSLTYTYAAGTGDLEIPNNIGFILWGYAHAAVGQIVTTGDAGGSNSFTRNYLGSFTDQWVERLYHPATEGLNVSRASGTANISIALLGFSDNVLGVGSNPVL